MSKGIFVDYKVPLRESTHVQSRSSEFIDMPACNKHRKSRDSRVIWPRTLALSSHPHTEDQDGLRRKMQGRE